MTKQINAFILSGEERELIIDALPHLRAQLAGTDRIKNEPVIDGLLYRLSNEPPDVEIAHDAGGSEDLRLSILGLDISFSCPTCGTSVNRYI